MTKPDRHFVYVDHHLKPLHVGDRVKPVGYQSLVHGKFPVGTRGTVLGMTSFDEIDIPLIEVRWDHMPDDPKTQSMHSVEKLTLIEEIGEVGRTT